MHGYIIDKFYNRPISEVRIIFNELLDELNLPDSEMEWFEQSFEDIRLSIWDLHVLLTEEAGMDRFPNPTIHQLTIWMLRLDRENITFNGQEISDADMLDIIENHFTKFSLANKLRFLAWSLGYRTILDIDIPVLIRHALTVGVFPKHFFETMRETGISRDQLIYNFINPGDYEEWIKKQALNLINNAYGIRPHSNYFQPQRKYRNTN